MSKYYNICLTPEDTYFSQYLINLTNENFSKNHADYILSNDVLPHVTLCQFTSIENNVSSIWNAVHRVLKKEYKLKFEGLYINPIIEKLCKYLWIGLIIQRDANIIGMQSEIYKILSDNNCKPLTATGEQYFPHLTLACIHNANNLNILKYPTASVFSSDYIFKASLGISDEMGRYYGTLFRL